MSFYRTYRPQTIAEIDNAAVRERITAFVAKDRKDLPHAFLLTGPKGAGKTTAARIIAKLFNCIKPGKDGPCGTCEQCVAIAAGTSLDVLEMDAASNRGIDDIRELRDRVGLAPSSSAFKVYVIDEVHMLTTEAFNALLKTLEEPPAHAVFVLATTDPHKVLATIRSRCIEIPFRKASGAELSAALARIAAKEGFSIDKDAIDAIVDAADGAFRDAVKFLEQVSLGTRTVTRADVEKALSVTGVAGRAAFLDAVFARKAVEAIGALKRMTDEGADVKVLLTQCLTDLEAALVSGVRGASVPWDAADVRDLTHRLMRAFGEMRMSPMPELPLELAVIEFAGAEAPTAPAASRRAEPSKPVEPPAPVPAKVQPAESPKRVKVQPPEDPVGQQPPVPSSMPAVNPDDLITLEKLTAHWSDVIEELKTHNHSVAGVLRGTRPRSVEAGHVVIEAFYKFHQERLSDMKVRDTLAGVLKKLFGAQVTVDIALGKK